MNRIYRKVWNKSLGQIVVASELATGDGVGATVTVGRSARPALLALALLAAMPAAWAQVAIGELAECTVGGVTYECIVPGARVLRWGRSPLVVQRRPAV
ncbi:hypothetical protein BEN78_09310 [Xanthomonas citri pv. mangiferaeindicae]|nr:hypothetical protein BEN78_09310 [Xanthomonas citri pv. mangiferaeindicae]